MLKITWGDFEEHFERAAINCFQNIFKQTDELMRPGGAGGGGEGEDEGKGCEWCDPYIKETVSMYFDILYQEWSNSSLSMVILKVK